jgi:hypothetical protein
MSAWTEVILLEQKWESPYAGFCTTGPSISRGDIDESLK